MKITSDPAAGGIDPRPRPTSVARLNALRVPPVDAGTPRIPGLETTVWRVRARLVAMKEEEDSDIHLVVADPLRPRVTMIVEFPAAACTVGIAPARRRPMARARALLVRGCGLPPTSAFRSLRGTAVIVGVGFVDRIHGQRGVARNGYELHPVLEVSSLRCR